MIIATTNIDEDAGSHSYNFYVRDYLGSVRAVVGANGELWQFNDYHVTGIPSSQFGQLNADDRLHTGKEYNAFNGLHMYDNNARTQDPITGRFTTLDPLAEKYPNFSPYAHCMNNPLKYIDPDGKDYNYIIDHNRRSINISANFNNYSSAESLAATQQSASTWNAQSGKFNYVINNESSMSYSINFDISINQGDQGTASNYINVIPDNNKIFEPRTEGELTVFPQGGSDGQSIGVKASQQNNTNILSHEMGHNIGLSHNGGGIMQPTVGGNTLGKGSILEILKNIGVIKGDNKTNAKIINSTEIGNSPQNFEQGKIKENEDWKKVNF